VVGDFILGFNIRESLMPVKKEITIENLFGKKVAIDAFNVLYQFLFIIKGKGGKPLKNLDGDITSHLSGLFYRNTNFFQYNITPVFCFDGIDKQKKIRWSGKKSDVSLTLNMIESGKELLTYMGIPWIQAPSEGEAQCVYITRNDEVWATCSQDYDVLSFGGARFIRNLTMSRTRKQGDSTIFIPIEFIILQKFFDYYNITREQLIDISILMGNDFFPGLKGVGEKTAFKIIGKCKCIEEIPQLDGNIIDLKKNPYTKEHQQLNKDEFLEIIESVRKIFLEPKVSTDYSIKKGKIQFSKIAEFLIEENNFSEARVRSQLNKLKEITTSLRQASILDFKDTSKKIEFIKDKIKKNQNTRSNKQNKEIFGERMF